MEEVDKIIDRPTFNSCNKVINALKTNCISIEDDRSGLGKLHCITNLAHMEYNGVGVVASINPRPLSFAGLDDTQAAKDTYPIGYYAQKEFWAADKNLKEAAKRSLMSRIDPTYFQELAHGVTGYKGVSIEDLIDFLQEEYPPEPEDIVAQEQSLLTEWNPNNHIHDLFDAVKLGMETLLQMDAINFNSFQAIVPLTGQEKVVLLRGCNSLKNQSYRPLLRASTSPFKSMCLFSSG
jgi:hypothetical protein